jgi:hypothetical protein
MIDYAKKWGNSMIKASIVKKVLLLSFMILCGSPLICVDIANALGSEDFLAMTEKEKIWTVLMCEKASTLGYAMGLSAMQKDQSAAIEVWYDLLIEYQKERNIEDFVTEAEDYAKKNPNGNVDHYISLKAVELFEDWLAETKLKNNQNYKSKNKTRWAF